jgi:hypothetical protein
MLSPGRRSGAGRAVGEQGWSDISNEYNIGLVVQLITRGIELGRIPPQPLMRH